MIKNEVKKELLKSMNAKLSHYTSGNLYYTVQLNDGTYQFPMSTVQRVFGSSDFMLSEDLGTTSFYNEMRGSELNRWIDKAIEKGEFIKIS